MIARRTLAAMLLIAGSRAGAESVDPDRVAGMIAECPKVASGDIIVCGRDRRREQAHYRLPLRTDGFDPDGAIDSVARERHRLYEAGGSGTGSCSASGGGGWTGCMIQQWRRSDQQHGR